MKPAPHYLSDYQVVPIIDGFPAAGDSANASEYRRPLKIDHNLEQLNGKVVRKTLRFKPMVSPKVIRP